MKVLPKVTLVLILLSAGTLIFAQKVQTFTISRTINAPANEVWAVVGEDFGAIANSHPQIVSSNYINGSLQPGEGAERVCNFNEKGSKYVQEKQVEYNPEAMTFKAQVFHANGLPMVPELTFATYKVEKIDENTSRLVFSMTYRTKPAFMGAMFKGKFRKTIEDYLLAVDHHVKTGETVNKDNFKSIKKSYKKAG